LKWVLYARKLLQKPLPVRLLVPKMEDVNKSEQLLIRKEIPKNDMCFVAYHFDVCSSNATNTNWLTAHHCSIHWKCSARINYG
jgi:hypothetical protein